MKKNSLVLIFLVSFLANISSESHIQHDFQIGFGVGYFSPLSLDTIAVGINIDNIAIIDAYTSFTGLVAFRNLTYGLINQWNISNFLMEQCFGSVYDFNKKQSQFTYSIGIGYSIVAEVIPKINIVAGLTLFDYNYLYDFGDRIKTGYENVKWYFRVSISQ